MVSALMIPVVGIAALLLPVAVGADTGMADPTRPPSAAMAPPSAAAQAPAPGSADEGEPVLQSVFLPKGGKPAALISGQRRGVGDKLGEARISRITETEVVLRGPGGEKRLYLNPAVSMKPAQAVRPAASGDGKRSMGRDKQ